MCVFISCQYRCATKAEHHSKYARMRRTLRIEEKTVTKSRKVNWNMVEELKVGKAIIRKKRKNHDEEILEE